MGRTTSDFFTAPNGLTTNTYSDFEEIASSKYTVIVKARKYGQWFVLKALAEDYRGRGQYESLLTSDCPTLTAMPFF